MNRRKALTAISGGMVTALAGCTMTSQNGTDNAAEATATSEVEDGLLSIQGEAWFLCHSGQTNELVVEVYVKADGVVEDTLRTTVEGKQCGVGYGFSLTYDLDNIDGDWTTVSVEADLIERRR